MPLRTKYLILYLASIILPIILLVVGLFFTVAVAKNKFTNFSIIYLMVPILLFLGGFIINYWYASKLKISPSLGILAGVFNGIGFLFLMGYDQTMISAQDIIKKSWELFKNNWKILSPYLIIMFLPNIVFYFISLTSTYLNYINTINTLIFLTISIASLIFTLWASIALAQTLKKILIGAPTSAWQETFKENSRYIGPVILVSVLVGLIVLGGTLLLIIPGIIFSIWYSFVFYTVIFEDKRGLSALSASKNMVINRWWIIAWRIFAPALFFSLCAMLIQWVLYWPLEIFINTKIVLDTSMGIINSALNVLLAPLTATASILLYMKAKTNAVIEPKTEIPSPVAPPTQM